MNKWALFILLIASQTVLAQVDSSSFPKDIFANTTKTEQWMADNHVPVLGVGVISGGRLQKAKVFGQLKKRYSGAG